ASCMVSSVSGTPCASYATPPTSPSFKSKESERRFAIQSATRRSWRITSGPMPSPASARTLRLAAISARLLPQPRGLGAALGLVGIDVGLLLQGEADAIESLDEAALAEGIDLEGDLGAVGTHDHLIRQIDGEPRIGAVL